MPIDACTHSLFGVSKAAADLLVQEYGRYFDMPTVCFRGGCLTGPQHAGAQLHGFLAYLMRCTVTGEPYTIFGYDGKQVRDNIHCRRRRARPSRRSTARPRPAAVYNLGGGREAQRLDARGDRRCASGSAAARSTGRCPTRRASATTAGGSPTSRRSRPTIPDWELTLGIEDDRCARSTTHNVERWAAARREALGRHPGPQRGGLDRAPR